MMTLRARIFIILTVFVLVVLSISLFLYTRGKSKAPENSNNTPDTVSPNQTTQQNTGNNIANTGGSAVVTNKPVVVKDPVAVEKSGVEQLAKVFTERYQTFSSDNNYENIKQVQSMVTADLWKNLSSRLSVPPSKTFTGVTTQVFATDLTLIGSDKANVTAQTRRITTDQNGRVTTVNQNYNLQLIKTGNVWLVDSFVIAK